MQWAHGEARERLDGPAVEGAMEGPLLPTERWAALPARLGLALVMFPHGAQKAFGWFGGEGLQATVRTMTDQGLPGIVPVLVILVEGSLVLLVGWFARLAAIGIATVMLDAIFLVHARNGFFMNWTGTQAGEGVEFHLRALALAMVVLITGGGALSIDRALACGREEPAPGEWTHVGVKAPDTDPVTTRR